MEEHLGEQFTKLRPLISGISGNAGTLARWELRYIQKVVQEGLAGIPRLVAALVTALVLSVLALITLVVAIAQGISAAGLPLWSAYAIVTVLLAATAGAAIYLARRWIGPQLNVVRRLKEHWQRCFSAATGDTEKPATPGAEAGYGTRSGYTTQGYRSEVH